MSLRTIEWQNNGIRIIDQQKLPDKLVYNDIKDITVLRKAIKELRVRGAPALAAAAGLGVYLAVKDSQAQNYARFKKELDKAIVYLASSRPTAKNLFWGLERMRQKAYLNKNETIAGIKKLLFREAQDIIEEDRQACRKIGCFGARLIRKKETILTICNAGILATIDYGTALGVIYRAKEEGRAPKVFACETRPLLQGSRLTTWELKRKGIDVTLATDSTAGLLMACGKIDKVIAGADRIAANGDAANKIGTLTLAILAKNHRIPFYIAAPSSSFDLSLRNGSQIPIEERSPGEVTGIYLKKNIAARAVNVFNPAFDVTPNELISAIITEKGIIRKPYRMNIANIIGIK